MKKRQGSRRVFARLMAQCYGSLSKSELELVDEMELMQATYRAGLARAMTAHAASLVPSATLAVRRRARAAFRAEANRLKRDYARALEERLDREFGVSSRRAA